MRHVAAHPLPLLVVLVSVVSSLPVFAAPPQRTFVASSGNDANPCSLTQPCRGFSTAISAVADGGEVIALDSAGYGQVVIAKSVSIIAPPGVYAGISVFSGDGVSIATPGVNVTLKGLAITGLGGDNGIHMTDGASLRIDGCTVTGFTALLGGGINVSAAASVVISGTTAARNASGIVLDGGAQVQIAGSNLSQNSIGLLMNGPSNATTRAAAFNTIASGNGVCGFQVAGQGSFAGGFTPCTSCTRSMTVTDSTASANGWGICQGGAGASAFVSGTTASENANFGFIQQTGGTFASAQNNPATGNGSAPTSGTITNGGVLY